MEKQTNNIYTALLAAQREMGPVYKNATNPAFKSTYAELSSVIDTISETLNKHGIVHLQPLEVIEGEQYIKTMLVHTESDTSITSLYKVVSKDPTNPQAVGGGITYGRRYSLMSILGLAPEDDDGNLASQKAPQSPASAQTEPLPWEKNKPASKAATDGDTYYNEYEKKTYHPEECSHRGRVVPAKSVSFSMHKFNKVLCFDDQKLAEAGELDTTPEPITKAYGGN
jgi:hypothetical protein